MMAADRGDDKRFGAYLDVTLPEAGLTTHVDPRRKVIEMVRTINGRREKLILDTMDKRVREGLIALGWTPPAK